MAIQFNQRYMKPVEFFDPHSKQTVLARTPEELEYLSRRLGEPQRMSRSDHEQLIQAKLAEQERCILDLCEAVRDTLDLLLDSEFEWEDYYLEKLAELGRLVNYDRPVQNGNS